MSAYLASLNLNIAEKLLDRGYRASFFIAEASAQIAKQLVALRKRRKLTQVELAALAGTGQPAISRAERADYRNWSFNTLRSLAEAMDARISVTIEAAEDVLHEYDEGSLAKESKEHLESIVEYYRALHPKPPKEKMVKTAKTAASEVSQHDSARIEPSYVVKQAPASFTPLYSSEQLGR